MNEDLTDELGRELHHRVDRMHDTPLDLAGVQGKARAIRRTRRALAAGGAALAVAVVVPAVFVAGHALGGAHSEGPSNPTPTPSPSATATETTGSQPAPGELDVSHLPTGAAPAMSYLQDDRLHFHDGGAGDLHWRYTPNSFVEMNDGSRVWQTTDNGTPYVEIQDSDGGFHAPVATGWGLTVNPTHTAVAWLDTHGQVILWEARATDPRPLGDPVPGSDLRLGPLTGEGIGAGGGSGPGCAGTVCTVYVNAAGSPGKVYEVSDSGTQQLRDGGYLKLADMSQAGLSIGLTKVTDSKTCSKLLGSGEFQGFETCANQLDTFSPDGQLILAWPSYFDGAGPGGIAVYDLQGTPLFERSATADVQSYVTGAVWEDDTHLLAPAYQDGKWALVRIASDGTMEYAVPPTKGPFDQSPFVLPVDNLYAAPQ